MQSGNNPFSGSSASYSQQSPAQSGVEWNMLLPEQQVAAIKSSSPQAQPAQNIAPSPDQGGSNGGSKGGGLLGNISNALGGNPTSGSLLSSIKNSFGPNQVSTANQAITQQLQSSSPQALSQSLLGSTTQTSMPQKTQGAINPISVPGVQGMAQQAFPNNPVMQQVAPAVAAQESGLLSGKPSGLASQHNNLFGMSGTDVTMNNKQGNDLHSYKNYNSPQDSVNDFAKLMKNPRYAGVVNAKTPQEAFVELQKAGYATDPNYSKSLTSVYNIINSKSGNLPPNQQPAPLQVPAKITNTEIASNGTVSAKERNSLINGGTPIPQEVSSSPAYQQAQSVYQQAKQTKSTTNPVMAIVDYSKPITQPRMTVVNMETGKVLMQTYVAHGSGSGAGVNATSFSNTPESHQSSLGTFMTQTEYNGKYGDSMKVQGMQKGINDNAASRDIVIHGSNYVGEGKTGHSFGCFAVPQQDATKLIHTLGNNAIVQAYYPQAGNSTSP